jgi:hypothetical protein
MNAKALIQEHIKEAILMLDEENLIEPTNEQLLQVTVPNDKLELAWCGGNRRRGCGNRFNLFTVQYEDGFAVCPYCGKRN